MKIVTFLNHKGGVSKTVSCIHLSFYLTKIKKGSRVLLIDLDHQMNLTDFFVKEKSLKNIETVFSDYNTIDESITETRYKNISILQGSENIPLLEHQIQIDNHPWDCLQNIFKKSKRIKTDFDYVIIDTHPGIYPFVTCALIASNYYIIPLVSECNFSLDGLLKVEKFIDFVKQKHNSNVSALGYFITQFVKATTLSQHYLECMEKHRPELLFKSRVRRTTHIPHALSRNLTVAQYCPQSLCIKDYKAFTKEFLGRIHG